MLMSAVTVDDLSQGLFNHLVPERYATQNIAVLVSETALDPFSVLNKSKSCSEKSGRKRG